MQVALIIFLTVASLLVFAFFSYHLVLILSGMTSYESYKWTMLYKMRAVEQEAEVTAGAAPDTVLPDVPYKDSAWSEIGVVRALRSEKRSQFRPVNLYDRGMLSNLQDAFAPPNWAGQALMVTGLEVKRSAAGSKKHT